MRPLAPLLVLALLLASGPVMAMGLSAPLADRSAVEVAQALPLPVPPALPEAPVVVTEDVARVVQPVVAAAAPRLVGPPPASPPALTADDVAALEAEVQPVPVPLPPAVEPYRFPRDEPALEPSPLLPLATPPLPLPEPDAAPIAAPPAAEPLALAPVVAGVGALALLGAALYVRLAPAEALASPARQRVFDAVRADPGCTVNTVARALGIDYKTAQHHLRVLRRSGFVQARAGGKWERYFVAGDLAPGDQQAALALRAPSARALRDALGSAGRARAADLARALALSEATASVQLRRLEAAGLARRGPDGLWAAA